MEGGVRGVVRAELNSVYAEDVCSAGALKGIVTVVFMKVLCVMVCVVSFSLCSSVHDNDRYELGEGRSAQSQPMALENADGRCVRNALLQMFVPMVRTIRSLDATRRLGRSLSGVEWSGQDGYRDTCAERVGVALLRTVESMGMRCIEDKPFFKENLFHAEIERLSYGYSQAQYQHIARMVADGISRVTLARVTYAQLPVVRDVSFDMGAHLSHELRLMHHDELPDYMVIDVGTIRTGDFDKHSDVIGNVLDAYREPSLPVEYMICTKDGEESALYTLVSFSNFERRGMAEGGAPTWSSRLASFLEWGAWLDSGIPISAFPVRHATAVVRYGTDWFIADDICIWKASFKSGQDDPLRMGQALLSRYPGMRTVLVYEKVKPSCREGNVIACARSVSPLEQEAIQLHAVFQGAKSRLSFSAKVCYVQMAARVAEAAFKTAVYLCAWNSWSNNVILRYLLACSWVYSVARVCIGGTIQDLRAIKMLNKQVLDSLELGENHGWKSGLYSQDTTVEGCREGEGRIAGGLLEQLGLVRPLPEGC